MKHWILIFTALLLGWLGAVGQMSADTAPNLTDPNLSVNHESGQPHVARLIVQGAIGPAVTDYLLRAMQEAEEQGARAVVIQMDTPGGLDAATRDIIKAILASPLPVITYVYPSGGRAASAGTYILYASHIAAMAPATTLGAATPIQMGGGQAPGQPPGQTPPGAPSDPDTSGDREDRSTTQQPATAMERKIINDAVAFIRGLADRHDRNADWAEAAVREAVSLTASEALEQRVVDLVAIDLADLLQQADGREVQMERGRLVLALSDLPVVAYDPDWRNEILAFITNPQFAYILLLMGIYGLILEGYNPGAMLPGVVGVISLLLALYALQLLPVNYAGLALIVVGSLLIVAEAMVPSFGILGIGGVVALVFGSVMLFDTDVPGLTVPIELIATIGAVSALLMLAVVLAITKSLRIAKVAIEQAMVGRVARVTDISDEKIEVKVGGELWAATSDEPLQPGQWVQIVAQEGLRLKVKLTAAPENTEEGR
ncbi:NfeD family protein [Nitrincola sp. MINF-07-Sa-05]|uniref:NfeD family protein n=1 Tax=Nitrincola salilacus TaxID=3400273 RepID=UPI003917C402